MQTDCCLARLADELAKLTWQPLPQAEEIFGFIVSTKPLIFMQLVLSQLSARLFLSLKLAKRFKLFLRRGRIGQSTNATAEETVLNIF